jgi:general secretion pathway protein E/type IV pilus assembly protein PilB
VYFAQKQIRITGESLGKCLHRDGLIIENDLAIVLSNFLQLDYIDITDIIPEPEALISFNLKLCIAHQFIPLKIDDKNIVVAYTGVGRNLSYLKDIIYRYSGHSAIVKISEIGKIERGIEKAFDSLKTTPLTILEQEIAIVNADDSIKPLDNLLLNLFKLAIEKRATDIHISPLEKNINISFRIDGIMIPFFSLDLLFNRLISTIKTRATLDIAEKRLPQDGSFQVEINHNEFDIRVSTLVGIHGENIVMRLLSMRTVGALAFHDLGFLDQDLKHLKSLFQIPYGLVVLTGPTGSGKTTTLHAGIQTHDLLSKNIVTVEDPIEYRIPLILQTQVNEKAGYTFSSAIRHFLRHDPDVILVGEMRDPETAKTALTAAETGHLVLSTLHANNVFGVIPRLQSLGIGNNLIADSLAAIVAQRLVRKICLHCKQATKINEEDQLFMGLEKETIVYEGKGCDHCNETGFYGREPIYEILEISEALMVAISSNAGIDEIISIAKSQGFKNMQTNAKAKALLGIISIDEIRRTIWLRH